MPKYTLKDIVTTYEKKQRGIIEAVLADIMALFDEHANLVAFMYAKRKLVRNTFLPKDVRSTIERLSNTVNARAKDIIINGIKRSWQLSERKNTLIETLASGGRKPPTKKGVKVSAPGKGSSPFTAVDAFIKRKEGGLNLSKRVWKLSNSWKKTINVTLVDGLKEGTPANKLATKLRAGLRNNTYQQHPGRGIYRSPQKNAQRLTRTEIGMAYAHADHQRWANQWFVVGIEVRLSAQHPKYDICDHLKGTYPKDFVFTKWHPNCLCTAVPKLAPQEQRDQMMDFQLGHGDRPDIKYVESIPRKAAAWMENNADRVNGWKNEPYWLRYNKKSIGEIFR